MHTKDFSVSALWDTNIHKKHSYENIQVIAREERVRWMNEIGEFKKMYLDILVEKAITSLAKLIKGLIPRTYSQVHI